MVKKEQREVSSYFAAERMISYRSKFGRTICGIYRSEYERRFAMCLKYQKVKFEFEKYAFKLIKPCGLAIHYIPDFHIVGTRLFIEIQRHMNARRRHQILMFQQQYSNLTLMVLNIKDIRRYAECKLDIDFDYYRV